jgi:signal peptidase II
MKNRAIGLLAALAAFALDQGFKYWALFVADVATRQPLRLAPFFDIILVWNPGISYSLFPADSVRARYVLLALALTATGMLAFWLWRARHVLTSIALGLLVGGALGNAIDRYCYGAVADFFLFHVGRFSWYVFNIADVAIAVGVAVLLLESVIAKEGAKIASRSVP